MCILCLKCEVLGARKCFILNTKQQQQISAILGSQIITIPTPNVCISGGKTHPDDQMMKRRLVSPN